MTNVSGKEHIARPDRFFFGGEWVSPSSSCAIDVIDSATEEVFLTVAEAQQADVDRAVVAARAAFDHGPWPRMNPLERADYLDRIADAWLKRADAVSETWTAEAGVLGAMSKHAAAGLARIFREYAEVGRNFVWEEKRTAASGAPALLVREPVGVVAAIVPWNAPHATMAHKVAPALLAGCCMIVKASPEAPSTPYLFAEVCEEVGLPPGVVNVLTADRAVSELLVRNTGVDKVSFTGSTLAGRKIASICGDRIARVTLELGGKSPAVILDDYDLGKAAASLARVTPIMTGQVCAALTRVIVTERRHDEFVDALASAFGKICVGDPFDPQSQMGPLASERQRARVEGYIAQGVAAGARLATGGGRPAHLNRGYYFEPTVFGGVDNSFSIAQEEIFGPVVCVIPARDEAQAVEIANDTIYGLNSSVFTDDPDRYYAVARRLRAGTVGHNAFTSDFSIGFGGFKQSGLGREGGVEGLRPYLEAKTMVFAPPASA